MTKRELEQKIVGLVKAASAGKISPMKAYSQQCAILADYFADTSCDPPLATTEVAAIVLRRVGVENDPNWQVQVLAQRGDGMHFEIMSELGESCFDHEITATGIARVFEVNKPVA